MTPKSGRNIKTPKKTPSEKAALASTEEKTTLQLKASSPRKSPRSLTRHLISPSSSPTPQTITLDTSTPATHFQLYLTLPASIRGKIWRLAFPTPLPQHISMPPPLPRPRLIYPKVSHSKLKTFSLFPYLPKDIRILIWSFIIPPSRVHQLRLVRTKATRGRWNNQTYHSTPSVGGKDKCTWVSEIDGSNSQLYRKEYSLYSSAFVHGESSGPPITSMICRESRAFTLGVFEQSNIYERWRSWAAESWGWRKVWVHREDSFYFAWREWKFLKDAGNSVANKRLDRKIMGKVMFAMRMRSPKREAWQRLEGEDAPSEEETMRAAEVDLETQLLKILKSWNAGTGVTELSLVIDGRFRFYHSDDDNQPEVFVEPTSAYEDKYVDGGRQQILDLFDSVVDRIRKEHTEIQIPRTCRILLFTNGTRKQRRIFWDYQNGRANDEYVWDEGD